MMMKTMMMMMMTTMTSTMTLDTITQVRRQLMNGKIIRLVNGNVLSLYPQGLSICKNTEFSTVITR